MTEYPPGPPSGSYPPPPPGGGYPPPGPSGDGQKPIKVAAQSSVPGS
jgi:hypothetical protein